MALYEKGGTTFHPSRKKRVAKQPEVGSRSPWGTVDYVEECGDGIVFCGTPSHGGFWISDERIKALPKGYQTHVKGNRWHEEDCDAQMLAFLFGLPRYDGSLPDDEDAKRLEYMARNCGGYLASNWELIKAEVGVAV